MIERAVVIGSRPGEEAPLHRRSDRELNLHVETTVGSELTDGGDIDLVARPGAGDRGLPDQMVTVGHGDGKEPLSEVVQAIEDEGEIYDAIDEIWSDYPTDEDYLWNEDEY